MASQAMMMQTDQQGQENMTVVAMTQVIAHMRLLPDEEAWDAIPSQPPQ